MCVCVCVGGGGVLWLNWFNAELSPKRYWLGLRSKEVGKCWRLTKPNAALSPPE